MPRLKLPLKRSMKPFCIGQTRIILIADLRSSERVPAPVDPGAARIDTFAESGPAGSMKSKAGCSCVRPFRHSQHNQPRTFVAGRWWSKPHHLTSPALAPPVGVHQPANEQAFVRRIQNSL
jgi:hypothetical protein